jgi:hypothetical protein
MESALLRAFQAPFSHQALDAFPANANTSRAQLAMDPGATVVASASPMGCRDLGRERDGLRIGSGRGSVFPGIVAAARDAEHFAHGLDGEGHFLRTDESKLHSLSLAK